jgi:hypothetical protein
MGSSGRLATGKVMLEGASVEHVFAKPLARSCPQHPKHHEPARHCSGDIRPRANPELQPRCRRRRKRLDLVY